MTGSPDIAALVARLRNRREMVNCGHGDVRDIPDVDCEQAADALTAQQAALAAAGKNVEAQRETTRMLLWAAWKELNEIRARDGVPYTHQGWKSSVSEEYFSRLVDVIAAELGDDAKPWANRAWPLDRLAPAGETP